MRTLFAVVNLLFQRMSINSNSFSFLTGWLYYSHGWTVKQHVRLNWPHTCTCTCSNYVVHLANYRMLCRVHAHCTCTCSFFLGKVTALGVLCCFALFVCLTLLASFFLPSHLSFKNMSTFLKLVCYMYITCMYMHVHTCMYMYLYFHVCTMCV